MKRIFHHIFTGLCLMMVWALTMTSCGDFLGERSNDLAYIRTADDLDELLIGSCYMSVAPTTPRNYDKFYFPYLHYMADESDELVGTTRYNPEANIRPRVFGHYTWQQRVGDAFDALTTYKESVDWLRTYNHILTLNIVLDESARIATPTVAEQNRIKRIQAEAHFLRAAYYFYLVNLYARPYAPQNLDEPGVPVKNTHFIENKKYSRESIRMVYKQITDDLAEALKLGSGLAPQSLYRISEPGILLFASRVSLYMQDWKAAADYASQAMKLHPALTNLNTLGANEFFFTSANPELIFSMGGGLISAEMSSSSPIGGFTASGELYGLYAKEDLRAGRYLERMAAKGALPDGFYVRACKTDPKGMGRSEVSDIFVLRSAEIYLNLAEALAMQGRDAEALKWLNLLRQNRYKAGASYRLPAASGRELMQTVRRERRMELCFEGHRWFDVRRYRVNPLYPEKTELTHSYTIYKKIGRNNVPDVTYLYTLPAQEEEGYVLPLPREERTLNDQIQDNPRLMRKPVKTIQHETK